jgi:L-aminoadipate-semialdehyde dehydrogenase
LGYCCHIAGTIGLPDPTIDTDWSGYIGASHEIFHKNALKKPDAPWVTETASSTTPERRFDYKQIYEASNILANQLLTLASPMAMSL